MKTFFKNVVSFILIFAALSACYFLWKFFTVRIEEKKINEINATLSSQYNDSSATETDVDTTEELSINEKFLSLYEQNNELVGWLELPELSVPVVQTTDNSFYLTHDFYGEDEVHGSIFMDYRNRINPNDDNIVLYGHNRYAPNLKDTTMFYVLTHYRTLEYLQQHPTFTFDTLYEDGTYVIYAVFIADTDTDREDVFVYHSKHSFSTADEEEFIQSVKDRSLFNTNLDMNGEDKLIMLSTCDYDFTDERLVVAARKLRENETLESLNEVEYTVNPDPIMPVAWQKLYQ